MVGNSYEKYTIHCNSLNIRNIPYFFPFLPLFNIKFRENTFIQVLLDRLDLCDAALSIVFGEAA